MDEDHGGRARWPAAGLRKAARTKVSLTRALSITGCLPTVSLCLPCIWTNVVTQ